MTERGHILMTAGMILTMTKVRTHRNDSRNDPRNDRVRIHRNDRVRTHRNDRVNDPRNDIWITPEESAETSGVIVKLPPF